MLKFFVYLCLFLFAFCAVQKFCLKETDGFTVGSILSSRPYNSLWETRSLRTDEHKEVLRALDQSYTYFGCGGQSFIFFSEDKNTVLKVFKQQKFKTPLWIRALYFPFLNRYREKKIWSKEDKLVRDFTSYRIAFDELHEESGVLFVHLNPTNSLKKQIKLIDRLGIHHLVDADQLDFVVQKRAELVYDRITRCMAQGKIHEAKKAISSVLQLIKTRGKKGYHDRDPNIRTNCGFVGDKAIKIDIGRFVKREEMKDPEILQRELCRIAEPFRIWLQEEYPELACHLEQELKK